MLENAKESMEYGTCEFLVAIKAAIAPGIRGPSTLPDWVCKMTKSIMGSGIQFHEIQSFGSNLTTI